MAMRADLLPQRGPNFPNGDGDPMPERSSHHTQITDLEFAITRLLTPRQRFYIGSNNFLYYNPYRQQDNVAPDLYLALDVAERTREKYQTWSEGGKFPDLVFEFLSPATRKADLNEKKDLYARLGAREYFVHDARPRIHKRLTAGWRLVEGRYQPIVPLPTGGLFSEVLGLELRVLGQWLRLIDPATGKPIPTPEEETKGRLQESRARLAAEERALFLKAQARRAETQARREVKIRMAAEQQAAHETATRLAAEEQARREAVARQTAEQQAAHEVAARQALEAELTALRAQLAAQER